MATASGITGLTLPGMMLEPGCSAGSEISASPASGPEFIQRRSFEIFSSATAQARSAPESSTAVSCDAMAAKRSGAPTKASPVRAASRAMARFANSGWALTPVPTAVPPSASRRSRGCADFDARRGVLDLRLPGMHLLADRDRQRVHEVRAPRLHVVADTPSPWRRAPPARFVQCRQQRRRDGESPPRGGSPSGSRRCCSGSD